MRWQRARHALIDEHEWEHKNLAHSQRELICQRFPAVSRSARWNIPV